MRYAKEKDAKPAVRIMFDTRKLLKDGTYAAKLEVRHRQDKRRYATGVKATVDEWEKMYSPCLRDKSLQKRKDINDRCIAQAKQVIDELGDTFTFDLFAYRYCGKTPRDMEDQMAVYPHFQKYADKVRKEGRIGTASLYICTMKNLKEFEPNLTFGRITVGFLKSYEKWMIGNGKTRTSVGMYLRNLRTIVNIAKTKKLITEDQYPFGAEFKGRYEIPVGENIKKALSTEDLQKILQYKPISVIDEWHVGIWLFSFYCNGMNLADIVNLKYENIIDGRIYFFREKTKRSKKKQEPVVLMITEPIRAFIDQWGQKEVSPKTYIFDIYKAGMTEQEKHEAKKLLIRAVDAAVVRMKKRLGIKGTVNLMSCRHTWSTLMMNADASIVYISKGLGHTSLKTTENYLAQFNTKKISEMGNRLYDITRNLQQGANPADVL